MYTRPIIYYELLHTHGVVLLYLNANHNYSQPISTNLFVLPPICVEIHRLKIPINTNKFRIFLF